MNKSVKSTDKTPKAATMTVKETTEKSGLSGHTLRFYEKIGLVTPERAANGHRYYKAEDIARLDFISKLKATGMPLALIQEYVGKPAQNLNDLAKRRQLLEKHCTDVEAHLAEVHENLKMIHVKIAYLKEFEKMAGGNMDLKSWLKFQQEHSFCSAELTIPKMNT